MKERPILMRGPLVIASLEDRKTQTRRIVVPQPDIIDSDGNARRYKPLEVVLNGELVVMHGPPDDPRDARYVDRPIPCPHGAVGDRLWVRETFARLWFNADDGWQTIYRADDNLDCIREAAAGQWKPSIHMPRWASRLTLEIAGVRVERLQEISEADICAELGCPLTWDGEGAEPYRRDLRSAFGCLWNEIYAKRGYSWADNPWVWCLSYRRIAHPPATR